MELEYMQKAIQQTQEWLDQVVIGFNFCPFAYKVKAEGRIRYQSSETTDLEEALFFLLDEIKHLEENPSTETTLLIYSKGFQDFEDYLQLLDLADALIYDQGYEGTYQLASFHPQYCFDGSEEDDPANYTNRAPYPSLHLLREASIEEALKHHLAPEKIPERNVEFARTKGLEAMQQILINIMNM
jgi:hypothetical protein